MNPQYYKCPEGHACRIEGEDVDPHNDVILDLFCEEHDAWMQPVPPESVGVDIDKRGDSA